MMEDILTMLPLGLFTLFAVMYHIGHEEYKKGKRIKWLEDKES